VAKRKGTKFNILLTEGNMKKSKSQVTTVITVDTNVIPPLSCLKVMGNMTYC
jgi:3D (Asp-Asp-Asp) domain-containing protein